MIVEALYKYIFDPGFIYQTLATLAVYLCIVLAHFYKRRHKRYNLLKECGIPGPKQSLMDGSLGKLLARHKVDRMYHKTLEKWHRKYGKVYGYFLGDEPNVIVTDLEQIRAIFMDENKCFTERRVFLMDSPFNDGILFVKYSRWKTMRRLMSPSLSGYNMRGVQSTMFIEDSIKQMLQYIDNKFEESRLKGEYPSIDVHELMKSTAINLISEIALKLPNIRVCEDDKTVQQLDHYLSRADGFVITLISRFPFLKPIFQFISDHYEGNVAIKLIYKSLDAKIDKSLKELANGTQINEKQEQIIDTLIRLHYERKLSRKEIISNALAVLIAGYDTTSTLLAYTFWVLAKHPDCQDKLRAELMAHGIESKYLSMVINETLRLYPNVTTLTCRLAVSNYQFGNRTIPKGTKVNYHNWLMNLDPEYWPNPEKFDPERFREGVQINPCVYAPFGLGERKCVGYQLAILEMKMITCDILLRYRLKIISPENLAIKTYAFDLSKPSEKIMLRLEKL